MLERKECPTCKGEGWVRMDGDDISSVPILSFKCETCDGGKYV